MKKYRKRWIISDTHFGHKNVLTYENRPFDHVDNMNAMLSYYWNRKVTKDDLVYHLGDVYMGMSREAITEQLNLLKGNIILVLGNHDEDNYNFFRKCGRFLEVSPYPILVDDWLLLSHQPLYLGANTPYANIHGHVHGDPRYANVSEVGACVCVEKWNYKPVDFDWLKGQIETLKFGDKNNEEDQI